MTDKRKAIPNEPISYDWDETVPVSIPTVDGGAVFRTADCTQCGRRTVVKLCNGKDGAGLGWLCNICDPQTSVVAGQRREDQGTGESDG